jgi:hypothetical protein
LHHVKKAKERYSVRTAIVPYFNSSCAQGRYAIKSQSNLLRRMELLVSKALFLCPLLGLRKISSPTALILTNPLLQSG